MIPNHLNWLRELPGKPTVVAEVKMQSPYGWVNPTKKLWWDAFLLCREVGDVISVHTDALWGGSFSDIESARQETDKPILAKGFHPTVKHVEKALAAGATFVLTVGWWPGGKLGPYCWHEAESMLELMDSEAIQCVWNARDPRTGQPRRGAPADVQMANEARRGGEWLCQASHIRGPADVVPGMDAILIGEGLYTQP